MSAADIRAKLRHAPGPEQTRVTVQVGVDDAPEEQALVVRRPTPESVLAVLREHEAGTAETASDAEKAAGGLRLMARLAAMTLYLPGAVRPLYDASNPKDVDELLGCAWLLDVQAAVMAATGNIAKGVEDAKGK